MYLENLSIHGIRNLSFAELTFDSRVNLFFGTNGSGKTSILEAIHLLSRGRSFRTRNLRTLIQHGKLECTCYGAIFDNSRNSRTSIGVNRHSNGNVTFKVRGETVNTASKLAETLPIQLINAESFELLTGSPAIRRAFLDWGVFHVEHTFQESWSKFQRCLKHRNSLLRHDKIDRLQLAVWDRELASLAEKIDLARRVYLDKLLPVLNRLISELELSGEYAFQYDPGWNRDRGLERQLGEMLEKDRKAGFTQCGPHRADIKMSQGKRLAAPVLSRGQSKMLVSALKLAQGELFLLENGRNCLFLLDDLPSELDRRHRQAIGRQLLELGAQVFLTAVEEDDLKGLWGEASPETQALFHVEQGEVRKLH